MASSAGNIVVAVRCRPLNSREINRGAKGLIRIVNNQVMLDAPDATDLDPGNAKSHAAKAHSFAFDHAYNSMCSKDDPEYASQAQLFSDLGVDLLNHAFEGYNTCIFAYGQTGSGKSYSMMGYGLDRGIIPLTCSALFDRIQEKQTDLLTYTVEVSFIEIYNEKVRDLLNPKNKGNLKVREHPSLGPYVEDLSKLGVENFADMERMMDEGNKARTVAATQMNETSSRSHSVFTVLLTQKRLDPETKMVGEKVSRVSLVDLAGSERANSTGATGQRLKEGANINKSLTTLGKVIAALAAASAAPAKGKKKPAGDFVPYRDSVLTWLLKDSLGGNSKTAMIAAISPADYEETLSTLRYADQAKKIQNKAVVNEDANAKLVRELKEELALLRQRVSGVASEATYDPLVPPEKQIIQYQTSTGEIKTVTKAALQEQLEQSEKLMADVNQTWEEKMEKTVVIQKEREQALQDLGIVIEKGNVGVHTPKKTPHLVNLCEDPLMSECLIYQIKPGRTSVGNIDSTETLDIRLSGASVLSIHCYFETLPDGSVTIHAVDGGTTMVNGLRIGSDKPKQLKSGYRIILADIHVFRFNHPEEVRKHRDSRALGPSALQKAMIMEGKLTKSPSMNELEEDAMFSGPSSPVQRPPSPAASAVDWNYARREAVVARLNGTDVDLDGLEDADLNRLFNDIARVRSHRRQGTSMGRPESRMSFMESIGETEDDGSGSGSTNARPFSNDTWTDDTSLDSALNFSQASTIEMETRLQEATEEMQKELDAQREEYEVKLKTLASSVTAAEATRVEKEKAEEQLQAVQQQMQLQLDEQKKQYERKMKRLSSRSRRKGQQSESFDNLDEQEEVLAKKVVQQWRSLVRVSLAQTVLEKAVLLKEANVFSRQFDKKVTYQFTIVDSIGTPSSALEGVSALAELDDVSDSALTTLKQPTIAVKVIDKKSCSIYVWSIERLQQKLQQMRRLFSLLDKPSYSQHFSLEDPFYSPFPPTYSFIGTACFYLFPLARKNAISTRLRIYSRHTGLQFATCTVKIKPLAVALSASDYSPDIKNELLPGSQLSLDLAVDSISGLDDADFSGIHCQIRLATMVGFTKASDDVLASSAAEVSSQGKCRLRWRKTVTLPITEQSLEHLRSGKAYIEFFAQCKPAYLAKCEKWDETREEKAPLRPWQLNRGDSDLESNTTGRRAETELITDQSYDVKAMVAVQELSTDGSYQPVRLISSGPLDPGVFSCRQGLQRRIKIVLAHGSGRQWIWKGLKTVRVGNIRLLDPRGHIMDSKKSPKAALQMSSDRESIEYASNGTVILSFDAGWDSSAHSSLFLDRTTAPGHRVLLEVSWTLQIEGCPDPVPFRMDIGLAIQDRDTKRPSKLFELFSSTKSSHQATQMYQVRLTPANTNKSSDLWRLNTASVFVRREEILESWKPRGVSIVEDYFNFIKAENALAEVTGTEAILVAMPAYKLLPASAGEDPDEKLRKAVHLWQKKFGIQQEIKLVGDPTWEDVKSALDSPSLSSANNGVVVRRMAAHVTQVRQADTTAKRGYLFILRDGGSHDWQRVWAVLRRPYLTFYKHSDEAEELNNVVNISTVRVDHSSELEEVLERKFAFGIYTPVSALFVSARTFPEMLAWLGLIDPSWQRS